MTETNISQVAVYRSTSALLGSLGPILTNLGPKVWPPNNSLILAVILVLLGVAMHSHDDRNHLHNTCYSDPKMRYTYYYSSNWR